MQSELRIAATEVYALFDNHAGTQGELKDIINRVNANNYIELVKEFEDSFREEILIKALQDILQQENRILNNSDIATVKQRLALPESKAFKVLGKVYQQQTHTTDKLSKVWLGESIARVLARETKHMGKSKPEDMILRIHEYVKKRLDQ